MDHLAGRVQMGAHARWAGEGCVKGCLGPSCR